MSRVIPTYAVDYDVLRPVTIKFGCKNQFKESLILDKDQYFFRTEAIVLKEIFDILSADELKAWGIYSRITELNVDGTAIDGGSHSNVKLLDAFKTNNAGPLFQDRVITYHPVRFEVGLTRVDSSGVAVETTFEELKAIFGNLKPIIVKLVIW